MKNSSSQPKKCKVQADTADKPSAGKCRQTDQDGLAGTANRSATVEEIAGDDAPPPPQPNP